MDCPGEDLGALVLTMLEGPPAHEFMIEKDGQAQTVLPVQFPRLVGRTFSKHFPAVKNIVEADPEEIAEELRDHVYGCVACTTEYRGILHTLACARRDLYGTLLRDVSRLPSVEQLQTLYDLQLLQLTAEPFSR